MRRLLPAFLLSLCLWTSASAGAAEPHAATLLPDTTVVYAEIADPAGLIDMLGDHPVLAKIRNTEEYQAAAATPQSLIFQLIVSTLEAKLGQKWKPLLFDAIGEEIAVGYDPAYGGAVLLAQAKDPDVQRELMKALFQMIRDDAERKAKPDPIEEATYHDVTVYKIQKSVIAIHAGTLLVSSSHKYAQAVLDRMLDGDDRSLAHREVFGQARQQTAAEQPTVWLFADMDVIRTTAAKGPLATGLTDNPVAELLVGGLIDNLRKAPYLTAAATLDDERLAVSLRTPNDPSWITDSRKYYFGPAGSSAPPLLTVDDTLLSLSSYRDLSTMWLRSGDLLTQKAADEVAKAETGLSTFFGGKDFGEEILGSLQPKLQIVLARQEFGNDQPTPAIRLPSFAVAGWLKDPETMRPELRRTFLSLVGFTNVLGAMQGRPQLDFEVIRQDGNEIVVTKYVATDREETAIAVPMYFNFSPSIAFVGDRIIISSTQPLVRELVEKLGKPVSAPRNPQTNTLVELSSPVLRGLLSDNREQLIVQNMLDKGHTREEAEQEIDRLLMIIDLVRDARLTLDAGQQQLNLTLDLRWEK